jgi:hypothetical protein
MLYSMLLQVKCTAFFVERYPVSDIRYFKIKIVFSSFLIPVSGCLFLLFLIFLFVCSPGSTTGGMWDVRASEFTVYSASLQYTVSSPMTKTQNA